MKFKFLIKTGIFIIIGVLFALIAAAQLDTTRTDIDLSRDYQMIGSSYIQSYDSGFTSTSGFTSPTVYWPEFDKNTCRERQDFIIQVAPGGCQPAVVRSDLLEEQQVPVFCKLMLIQTNPLIDVAKIRSVRFSGQYPDGVSGISYFPYRYYSAVRKDIIDTPVEDNMGYVVIALKQQKNEASMPDWVGGNLTAVIDYQIEDAFGIGKTNFYVSELDEQNWQRDYKEYSFWKGGFYLRAEAIESDRARISVYRDQDTRIATVTLNKGETSEPVYLPGFYCQAGLKIKLESTDTPVESALIQVDDKQMWVSKGDKILDGACSVTGLSTVGGIKKVGFSCSVANGRFDLKLNSGKVNIKVEETGKDSEETVYDLGSMIRDKIYLGYVGTWGKANKTRFAVIISDENSSNEAEFKDKQVYEAIDKVVMASTNSRLEFEGIKDKIQTAINSQYKLKAKVDLAKDKILILKEGEKGTINPYTFTLGKTASENKKYEAGNVSYEYYLKATQAYRDLVDMYPNDKRIEGDYFEPYSAEGLYKAAFLADEFEMYEDMDEFLSRLRRDYPDSSFVAEAEKIQRRAASYDSRDAKAVVNLRTGSYFIELLEFKGIDIEELNTELMIAGKTEKLGLNEIWASDSGTIQVMKIDENSVSLEYNKPAGDNRSSSKETKTLDLDRNKQTVFGGINVQLLNINFKKQAKVSLDSQVTGPRAYANFSFNIGIEKRGIQLSPNKTLEMMENIQKDIAKWGKINESLGKVVKGLKGACFATAAVLTVKNLLGGLSGEAMARTEVMTSTGGWNDYCDRIVGAGEKSKFTGNVYISPESCLQGHNSYIEKDVDVYAASIKKTNDRLAQAREGLVDRDVFDIEGQVTDREAMESKFRTGISSDCEAARTSIDSSGVKLYSSFCQDGTFEDLKELTTYQNAISSGGLSEVARDSIMNNSQRIARDANTNYDMIFARKLADSETAAGGWDLKRTELYNERTTPAYIKTITVPKGELASGDNVIRVFIPPTYQDNKKGAVSNSVIGGKDVLVKVAKDSGGNAYKSSGDYYTIEGNKIDCTTNAPTRPDCEYIGGYLALNGASKFVQSNAKAYQNRMLNPGQLQVKYFDRAPYKGLPAEVPFDVDNGWYVEMEYVLSGFGKPYDESGRLANFYICNVGENGLIEFKRKADDICRYYNGVTEDLAFPGLDATESRKLVLQAKDAIAKAIKYYGKSEATINGHVFKTGTSFGGEAGRCSDFMSPKDCQLMFNVCDPVICPSSRCDLGGAFPVDNVIQTGIIGSLVLCFPNIREGIYIPVCLSGVKAGIEGYLSILESENKCLNESLTTGRSIGICDEITSIYKCEFFWKQMVPFFDVLVPKVIEGVFSQGTRGGGEYLTVQSAWDNTQKSIDYFKDEYAVNSMNAFNMRSTEEAGTEICKAYVSTRYPTDFDLLTEPDSPVQYHAWFDENAMTTVTPYPTSHYKVYYHIYAGNDQGAYYEVYLKDISEQFSSAYSYTSGYYVVKHGYIAKGETIDEAEDFTAPSGYKQLCLSINGQDDCGFGKVSTSYAVNYLSDQYAAEQAAQQITTSKTCIAGKPSLYSMAQPNVQAGAEEVVQPELYNQGITRVCSTYNPGKQISSNGEYDTTNSTYDKWQDVGYCDDKTIRCWLDTESVKDVIQDKNLEKQTLNSVDTSSIASGGYLTIEESKTIANKASTFIETLKTKIIPGESSGAVNTTIQEQVFELERLSVMGPNNMYRARGLFLLGNLYSEVAKGVKGQTSSDTPKTEEQTKVEPIAEPTPVNTASTGTTFGDLKAGNLLVKDGVTYRVEKIITSSTGYRLIRLVNQKTSEASNISKKPDLKLSDDGYSLTGGTV